MTSRELFIQEIETFIAEGNIILSEAAMLCGFNNMSFFTKTFKQYIGTLPSEVKKTR